MRLPLPQSRLTGSALLWRTTASRTLGNTTKRISSHWLALLLLPPPPLRSLPPALISSSSTAPRLASFALCRAQRRCWRLIGRSTEQQRKETSLSRARRGHGRGVRGSGECSRATSAADCLSSGCCRRLFWPLRVSTALPHPQPFRFLHLQRWPPPPQSRLCRTARRHFRCPRSLTFCTAPPMTLPIFPPSRRPQR